MSKYKHSKAKAKLHKAITAYPDAKKHQIISFIKSGIRLFGYIFLTVDITTAVVILILSEILGIGEEMV